VCAFRTRAANLERTLASSPLARPQTIDIPSEVGRIIDRNTDLVVRILTIDIRWFAAETV
jgi:hypothetical protein